MRAAKTLSTAARVLSSESDHMCAHVSKVVLADACRNRACTISPDLMSRNDRVACQVQHLAGCRG
jgi:hypothetical protein